MLEEKNKKKKSKEKKVITAGKANELESTLIIIYM